MTFISKAKDGTSTTLRKPERPTARKATDKGDINLPEKFVSASPAHQLEFANHQLNQLTNVKKFASLLIPTLNYETLQSEYETYNDFQRGVYYKFIYGMMVKAIDARDRDKRWCKAWQRCNERWKRPPPDVLGGFTPVLLSRDLLEYLATLSDIQGFDEKPDAFQSLLRPIINQREAISRASNSSSVRINDIKTLARRVKQQNA